MYRRISWKMLLVLVGVCTSGFLVVLLIHSCFGGALRDTQYGHNDADLLDGVAGRYVKFPYTIPETQLTITAFIAYEGTFLENGGDDEVVNVSALILRNDGAVHIRYAHVTAYQENRFLSFELMHLPPGKSVLVIEKDRKLFVGSDVLSCQAIVQTEGGSDWRQQLRVEPQEQRCLIVKNITDDYLTGITVYFKTYYEPGDFYVGGISYHTEVSRIQKQEEIKLLPYRYSSQTSRVVWIDIWD